MNKKFENFKLGMTLYFLPNKYGLENIKIYEGKLISISLLSNGQYTFKLDSSKSTFYGYEFGKQLFSSFEKAKRVKKAYEEENSKHMKKSAYKEKIIKERSKKINDLLSLEGTEIFVKNTEGFEKSAISNIYSTNTRGKFGFKDEKFRQRCSFDKEGKTWFFANESYEDILKISRLKAKKHRLLREIKQIDEETLEQEKKVENFTKSEPSEKEIILANALFAPDDFTNKAFLSKDFLVNSAFTLEENFYTCPRCRLKTKIAKKKKENTEITKCPNCSQRIKIVPTNKKGD